MRNGTRRALATACALGLAIPVTAQAVPTTIRVEGADATLVPERTVDVPLSGSRTVTDAGGDSATVPASSATAQLAAATETAGVPLDLTVFSFGTLVAAIGPDVAAGAPTFSPWWRLKVNHADSQVGGDGELLTEGAEVLWAYGDGMEPELDVQGPAGPVPAGSTYTVTVRAFDGAGAPAAVPGVRVARGPVSAVVDAPGSVTLTADGAGAATLVATAPGAIRDSAPICTHPVDAPEACDLPALPRTPSPSPAATAAGAAGATAATPAMCRPLRERTAGGGDPSRVRASGAVHSRIRRYARTTIRRVAAIERWIDAGVVGSDVCGGALGRGAFGAGVTLGAGGATAAITTPTPRAVPVGATPRTRLDAVDAAEARATRVLVLTAMARLRAVESRLDGGLGSADVVDGTIGAAQITRGLVVAGTSPQALTAATPRTRARVPRVGRVAATDAATRVDMRTAVAGVRRSADLLDRIDAGLTEEQFAPGALGAVDLDPSLRP